MLGELAVYGGLFLTAFAAATILPMQSEAAVAGLLLTKSYAPALLIVSAAVGNVLGSIVNWWLGRCADRFRDRKWFPINPSALTRATQWYQRYGRWSLLLSWLPLVGDQLTIVAGVLREPFWSFLVIVTIAKVGRYLALAAMTLSWM
ncbi:YqaA family protein [Mesorhizobium sp. M0618]|uniref:YqaA family protein n=1 Tax=unclassified Mesorhizobium TaxID=325217 RepID=UPI003338BEE6